MENEQTVVVDFDGANRIYLAGVLDEACAELPELPRLPVPSLNGDDPAVASLLHLMGQRDEMASASGALVCELGALKDTAKAAHARLADAQERVARAREALLSGTEPEPTRRTPISYAVFCLKKKIGREICHYLAAGHNSHCCHSALPDGGYHAGTTDGAGNRTGEGNGPVRDVSGPGLP